ncbi:pseudoazurin [Sphingobium sp. HWE2-09]|uniref:pseudoazurin n=1 Tax=Sphingobium sp. HWE2-09 TaxID=3108390 RepID=UPI002DD2C832|nr:pseudoazurin [Sphingobium sp. HWE2-09]
MFLKFLMTGMISVAMIAPATGKTITVEMKNKGAAGFMIFEPAFVQATVGDVITFVPTDPGHNAETIPGILPDGVPPSAGAMNKIFTLRLTKDGLYGIECKPHFGMGMVALVKVGRGKSSNAAKAMTAKLPPLAKKRMTTMLLTAN